MFPLSHTYVSTQVVGRKTPLLVFGSIIPDVVHLSKSGIERTKLHDNPSELIEFIRMNYPELVDFSVGIGLHSPFNKGADHYSDDLEVGFAKIEGKKLLPGAASLWRVVDSETSLNLAHNFIEASVDLHIAEDFKDIVYDYQSSLDKVDLGYIAKAMAQFLNLNSGNVEDDLKTFCIAFRSENLISAKNLIEKVIIPWREKLFNIRADVSETTRVFSKAYEISRDYKNWLDLAVKQMKIDFQI